jgi:Predicted pyridoxal phosphate-dependent enzyme apparently involved in regulation of cell wall biogenesis
MNPIPAARIVIPEEDRRQILERIDEALSTGALTLGKNGEAFEAAFARIVGARYAVAVQSGTSALEIILRSLGVEGHEVVVPTNTFFATLAAVIHSGGRPRFADVDRATLALSLDTVAAAISPETVGVVLVHIGGLVSPDTPKIAAWCRERGLFLVEDAAHAHASSLNGRMAGTFGRAAAFSFYPTKVITAGEGGLIVTDDVGIYEQALQYRDQGKEGFLTNFHRRMGYNWRLSELHAAVGLSQLGRLEQFVAERRRVAEAYTRRLAGVDGIHPLVPNDRSRSNFYKYVALLDRGVDRPALKRTLKERFRVSLSGEVYEIPCHRQPVFKSWASGTFPVAEDVCSRHICLPIYPGMTEAEVDQVVLAIQDMLSARIPSCASA